MKPIRIHNSGLHFSCWFCNESHPRMYMTGEKIFGLERVVCGRCKFSLHYGERKKK